LLNQLPSRLLTLPGGPDSFNPNQVAGVLLWVAPLALALTAVLLLNPGRLTVRWPWVSWLALLLGTTAATLFITAILIFTQSRSALIGLAVALTLMAGMAAWRRSPRLLIGVGLLVLLSGVALWQAPPDLIPLNLSEEADLGLGDERVLNSLDGRKEIWSRAIYGLQDFPFTGMGMGTFRRVVHILYPLFLISPTTDIAHAHNHLLQTGLDLGIPGMIAYLALWLGAALMLWQSWRDAPNQWLTAVAVGLAGSLAAYFVYGLTDAVALGAKPGFLFWYLLALVVALRQATGRKMKPFNSPAPTTDT
jgi:putative inorganic carbon (hco3(-)) transporter